MTLWNEQLVNVQEGMDKTSVDQKKKYTFYVHPLSNKQLSVLMPLNWINECKVYM